MNIPKRMSIVESIIRLDNSADAQQMRFMRLVCLEFTRDVVQNKFLSRIYW